MIWKKKFKTESDNIRAKIQDWWTGWCELCTWWECHDDKWRWWHKLCCRTREQGPLQMNEACEYHEHPMHRRNELVVRPQQYSHHSPSLQWRNWVTLKHAVGWTAWYMVPVLRRFEDLSAQVVPHHNSQVWHRQHYPQWADQDFQIQDSLRTGSGNYPESPEKHKTSRRPRSELVDYVAWSCERLPHQTGMVKETASGFLRRQGFRSDCWVWEDPGRRESHNHPERCNSRWDVAQSWDRTEKSFLSSRS